MSFILAFPAFKLHVTSLSRNWMCLWGGSSASPGCRQSIGWLPSKSQAADEAMPAPWIISAIGTTSLPAHGWRSGPGYFQSRTIISHTAESNGKLPIFRNEVATKLAKKTKLKKEAEKNLTDAVFCNTVRSSAKNSENISRS